MNYPTELQEMQREREAEGLHRKKQGCLAAENGGCFCTGQCMHTREEWERLERIKQQFKFTGVDEMKNVISDSQDNQ